MEGEKGRKLEDVVLDVTRQHKVTDEVRTYLRAGRKFRDASHEINELRQDLARIRAFHGEVAESHRKAEVAGKTLVARRLEDSAAANLAERKIVVARLRALGIDEKDEFVPA